MFSILKKQSYTTLRKGLIKLFFNATNINILFRYYGILFSNLHFIDEVLNNKITFTN